MNAEHWSFARVIFAFLTLLTLPLSLLSGCAEVVAAIWLAIVHEWMVLIVGTLWALAGAFVIALALIPSLLFTVLASKLVERGRTGLGVILASPAVLYGAGVMLIWCYGVIDVFTRISKQEHLIPVLIWSYGAATAPWSYLANKESDGADEYNPKIIQFFFVCVGYCFVIAMRAFWNSTLIQCFQALIVIMMIAAVVQLILNGSFWLSSRTSKQL